MHKGLDLLAHMSVDAQLFEGPLEPSVLLVEFKWLPCTGSHLHGTAHTHLCSKQAACGSAGGMHGSTVRALSHHFSQVTGIAQVETKRNVEQCVLASLAHIGSGLVAVVNTGGIQVEYHLFSGETASTIGPL